MLTRPAAVSRVEKFTLTPEANNCDAPPKVEAASNTSPSSFADFLSGLDPCKIPEKDLKKELKGKKHDLVFSGSNLTLQVQCSSQPRMIRADIVEKDWFAKNSGTPKNTSWMMQLLDKLDNLSGPSVMDKPADFTTLR